MKKIFVSAALVLLLIGGVSVHAEVSLSQDLKVGSTDASTNGEVSTLQSFLKSLGYFSESVTGYFGKITESAVKQYQAASAINPVSGIVGVITRSTISTTSATTTATSTTRLYTRDLTVGSEGADVKRLQTELVTRGFLATSTLTSFGYFGASTKAALASFQASVGISPADGYFGSATRAFFNPRTTPTVETGVDLEIKSLKASEENPYGLTMNVCVNGPKSINDLKKEISSLTGFPFVYYVFDSNGKSYSYPKYDAGGGIEDIKNGECMELGTALQNEHIDILNESSNKTIKIVLDNQELIKETNEKNNTLSIVFPKKNIVNRAPSINYVESKAALKNELYANESSTILYGSNFNGDTKVYMMAYGSKYYLTTSNVKKESMNINPVFYESIPEGSYMIYASNGKNISNGIEVKYINPTQNSVIEVVSEPKFGLEAFIGGDRYNFGTLKIKNPANITLTSNVLWKLTFKCENASIKLLSGKNECKAGSVYTIKSNMYQSQGIDIPFAALRPNINPAFIKVHIEAFDGATNKALGSTDYQIELAAG